MDKSEITVDLVRELLREQFPHWADEPIRPVEVDGWDNLTLRLGATMSIRLPRGEGYVSQVAKEHRWLPELRPQLPVAIPQPLGLGRPGAGFPRPWSIYRWLPGETAVPERIADPVTLARDLGRFVVALGAADATGGPEPDEGNGHRGTHPSHYDESARRAFTALRDDIDQAGALAVWEAALDSRWAGPPSWLHGDLTGTNMLLRHGRLSAVIDFGTCAVGDPACDLVVAWSMFSGGARQAFVDVVAADDGTWRRARGWMIWKAALTAAAARRDGEDPHEAHRGFGWRTGPLELIDELVRAA